MVQDTKSYQKWQWASTRERVTLVEIPCVFSKTNKVITLTSSAGQTSFVRNEDDDCWEDISNDGDQESDVDIGEKNIQDPEDGTTLDTGESQETNKQKVVVARTVYTNVFYQVKEAISATI